jgi:hypothetical protein
MNRCLLDLVALPMMQRLRHRFKIRTDTMMWLFFSVMILASHLCAILREIHLSTLLGKNLVEG